MTLRELLDRSDEKMRSVIEPTFIASAHRMRADLLAQGATPEYVEEEITAFLDTAHRSMEEAIAAARPAWRAAICEVLEEAQE